MSSADKKTGSNPAASSQDLLGDSTMSLGDHLDELRLRLLLAIAGFAVAFVVCLIFGRYIIEIIKSPYIRIMTDLQLEATLTVLAPAEVVVSYIRICMIAALIIASPWVFYHLWMFIAAGLYPKEKKYINTAIPFSTALFITGAMFFLIVVAPLCLQFFIKFSVMLDLDRNWTLQNYVSFITRLMLVFGVAFQTPIAIYFLNRSGLVSIKALTGSRKYVILGIVVLAAMATPPDVVSQITLAVPLYLLFEFGILLSYLATIRDRKLKKGR